MNFLQFLVSFSEKAARIARVVRHDPCLFSLLVEEKGELEKNARFCQDFKTLADVLIQETLRHYMSLKFPKVAECVRGEESSSFTNTLGENVNVHVCSTQAETSNLLAKVLDGNTEAANILSGIVHEKVEDHKMEEIIKIECPEIPLDNIGIWIDPIDSTAEYISGKNGTIHGGSNIYHNGVQCVTVLVGIFDKSSGLPIGGIINQPFAKNDVLNSRWMSKIYWGIQYSGFNLHCQSLLVPKKKEGKDVIVMSSSDSQLFQNELQKQFEIIHATGAGYKCLTVAIGLADAYFCSKDSTYRWDICAPHGILRSVGGGVISFKSLMELGEAQHLNSSQLELHQVKYHLENDTENSSASKKWCNEYGLVAYRNLLVLVKLYNSIKDCKC